VGTECTCLYGVRPPAAGHRSRPTVTQYLTVSTRLGLWRSLVRLLAQVGDAVIPGNAVAEIETDKASVAFEAQDEGFIAALLHPAGTQDIAVGTPIAVVVSKKTDVAAFANFTLADASGAPAAKVAAPAAPAAAAAVAAAFAAPAAPAAKPPPPPVAKAAAALAKPAAVSAPAAVAVAASDDLDGQLSWRSQVLKQSPIASQMLAAQLAYEERFGFTAMEPLERIAAAPAATKQ
jgi:pyruvate/2-oxoglutarate dehydrogenase complex dihydrolipoamide acyltransferase (E2) component